MLDFFKKLLSKQIEEKPFSEIGKWFERKITQDLELYDDLDALLNSMDEELVVLDENLEKLKNAELKNKEIPQRALQAMEGNRESYAKRVKDFIKQVEVPDKNDVDIQQFVDNISKMLTELNEGSMKQYFILKEFFANEARDIALSIKRIDELNKKIKKLIDAENGFNYVFDVRETIKNIEKKMSDEKNISDQLIVQEQKLKEAEAFKEKIETDIGNLETSSRYSAYSQNQNLKISTETDLRRHRENFALTFAPIEKALKKYEKVALESDKELIRDYLTSAVDALDNDRTYKILALLKSVAYKINELDIEEKKKEKILEAIEKFDSTFLKDFLWKYDAVKEKLTDINKRLTSNNVMHEIEDLNYKLKHAQEQIAKVEAEIKKINDTKKSLEINKSIKELEEKLNKLTPIKIT